MMSLRWLCLLIVAGCACSFSTKGRLLVHKSSASRSALSVHTHEKVTDVLVVGSGISGSTAAFYLNKLGKSVLLAESKDQVGGNIITKRENGFLWEEGPNSFQPNSAILRLAKDLNMLSDLVLADPQLPRYVFWDDQLHALPGGLQDLLHFNLLTWPGKIRAGLGALGCMARPPNKEETVREWVTRHLGVEVFERVIDPFVSGVYAGDPNTLSMKAALRKVRNLEDLTCSRSILFGALVRMYQIAKEKAAAQSTDADLPVVPGGSLGSFREGLQSIPLAIQRTLQDKVLLSHKLVSIAKDSNSAQGWTATLENPEGRCTVRTKSILLTTPASATARVLADSGLLAGIASQDLPRIRYPPVASVTLAYPTDAFKHSMVGFGNLLPRKMKLRTLGTIWSSSLFPGRAPLGQTLLLSYIGGAQDPGIADLSNHEIVKQVHEDVKRVLLKPDSNVEPHVLGVRLWPQAIPQYELGHTEILDRIAGAEQSLPGLVIGGNYRTGVAFGDCVQFGATIAKQVAQQLNANK